MKRILLTSALIGLGLPAVGSATDLNVDFTATVLATTCTITIVEDGGPAVTGSNDEYSLTIPDVGLDKYSAAIFLIPICISFDTAEKRRYATYLILNRRFSFEF
nr:hypothetical protein [Escherichia coli]EEW4581963.1 hypothetical protein [Escherichia coli]EEW4605087.1 hypothetical protein [Escherichia coli]EEW5422947.1 hypothetical protein [Escherichia coli]EEW7255976.1 hypothetical protein [Escherichia coli]